jgi:hypothetical protein
MAKDMATWREETLAQARAAQEAGDHRLANALACMVRDSIPRWAAR